MRDYRSRPMKTPKNSEFMKSLQEVARTFRKRLVRLGKESVTFVKSRISMLLSVTALMVVCGFAMTAQSNYRYSSQRNGMPEVPPGFTGIGPVVSGSVDYDNIPSKAKKFLAKNCDGAAVVKCEKVFSSGEYDLRLADGIEMEFDSKGNVIDVEAPEGYSLSPTFLKEIVPGKLYRLLEHNGFSKSVEAVHKDKAGYRMEVADAVFHEVCYDSSGGVLTLVVEK